MISYIGRINNSHVKNGTLTSEEMNSVVRASEELYERKYVKIYDTIKYHGWKVAKHLP